MQVTVRGTCCSAVFSWEAEIRQQQLCVPTFRRTHLWTDGHTNKVVRKETNQADDVDFAKLCACLSHVWLVRWVVGGATLCYASGGVLVILVFLLLWFY